MQWHARTTRHEFLKVYYNDTCFLSSPQGEAIDQSLTGVVNGYRTYDVQFQSWGAET